MTRKPNNVETFQLGHYEAMVIGRALTFYADHAPSTTETERKVANDFAHILGTGGAIYSLIKDNVRE